MRTQIAAANWKMNLSIEQAESLTDQLIAGEIHTSAHQLVLLAVPFPYLLTVKNKISKQSGVYVAAQNCASTTNGAYTGEVSAEMLKGMGISYVIIGHSERREYYHENNQILAAKVNMALEYGVQPVFCCGEPLSVREAGTQNSYVETQLKESLFHLDKEKLRHFIIAYEPIWAIGTGKTATSDQAQDMHAHIRKVIADYVGGEIADTVSILYGGSVKAANAAEIFGKKDVDGGLVGGASLVASEFNVIINSLKQ
ncbi:MAG: triose-phosphate isomerase [Ferruginibacter sp.]|nr:triose-phosphate isomerase [Ferruginibacter sp.]